MRSSSRLGRRVAAAVMVVAPLAAVVLGHKLFKSASVGERSGASEAADVLAETGGQPAPVPRRDQTVAVAGPGQGSRERKVEVIAAEPQNHPEAFEEDLAEIEQRGAFFQQAFERQGRDSAWADTMEQTVRRAYLADEGVDALLVSADCRGTMCRLEFKYPNAETRVPHLGVLARQFAELPQATYTYPDERHVHDRAVVYLARQGAEMPRFEASGEPAEESL